MILAGYQDDIEKKLYAYNDGLKSRFQEIYFEDFDKQDLQQIWEGILKEKGWNAHSKLTRIVIDRLQKKSGKKVPVKLIFSLLIWVFF